MVEGEVTNLPAQLTSFVGREAELEAVRELLVDRRLVTLTGAGGCGKTRLAHEVLSREGGRHPDGVWWVELGPLADPSLVPAALAGVLRVGASPLESMTDTVVAYLESRRALLVLDNCEHVVAASAALAARIIVACPQLTILATSREPLGVPGETLWQVPPLRLPSGASVQAIGECESVRLFLDRARASRSSFVLTEQNATAVAEICTRLDGIPLAIELAAARTRLLAIEEIAAGLADRFHLLTGGTRWALPRQRTLEASIDWSHDLLDESEQIIFRRLAVFAGSFTRDAAEAVCADEIVARPQILDLLSGLIDRSLVQLTDSRGPQARYRLFETMRVYASRRLDDADEHDATRARHLDFYVSLAREAACGLGGPNLVPWLARIDAEVDNLRSAMDWSAESSDARGVRVVGLLTLYWFARSDLAIGRAHLEATLDHPGADAVDRVHALSTLCMICYRAGDMPDALRYGDAAVDLGRDVGDEGALGRALHWRGWARSWGEADPPSAWLDFEEAALLLRTAGDEMLQALNLALFAWSLVDTSEATRARLLLDDGVALTDATSVPHARCYCLLVRGYLDIGAGDLEVGAARLDEAIALATDIGDHYAEIFARGFRAYADLFRGRYESGRDLCERGLRAALDNRSPMGEAVMRMALGQLNFAEGNLDGAADQLRASSELFAVLWRGAAAMCRAVQAQVALAQSRVPDAREYAEDALRLAKEPDTVTAIVWGLHAQASLARLDGDAHRAEDLLLDAVDIAVRTDRRMYVCDFVDELAGAIADQGRPEEAVRLLGAADTMRAAIGCPRFPVHEPAHEHCTASLRGTVGADAFGEVWATGASLPLDEALAYARRGRGSRKRPGHGWESLTPTEIQVVDLVAAGLTNPQIGERLFISKRTVQAHLAHVFRKLAVATRAELAAKAAERRVGS